MTEPTKRRLAPVFLGLAAAALVLGGTVAIPVLLDSDDDGAGAQAGEVNLDAVQTFDLAPPKHVRGGVAYAQTPPVGGDHNEVWLECGRYDEPLQNEHAVHDLEHGTVWITYRPDMSDADVALLADSLPAEGIMSPFDGLPSAAVVTVWGIQLQLDGADDPRLPLFLEEYGDGASAPESGASCTGGAGDPLQEGVDA